MLAAPGLTGIADATLPPRGQDSRRQRCVSGHGRGRRPEIVRPERTARPTMRLLAGSGEFETRKLRIRRGTGFWAGVWQEASTLRDGTGATPGWSACRLATTAGRGLLGLVAPDADGVTDERVHQLEPSRGPCIGGSGFGRQALGRCDLRSRFQSEDRLKSV